MADIGISETQFAFTYLHHYLNLPRNGAISFILPSLQEEGDPANPNGGADLVLAGNLFIQFKMPGYYTYSSAHEIQTGNLPASYRPYFRFNIKNTSLNGMANSGQYDMLLSKTNTPGNIVKYVVPIFDNTVYSKSIGDTNWWYHDFRTSPPAQALGNFVAEVPIAEVVASAVAIGNDDSHCVCYNYATVSDGGQVSIFSDKSFLRMKLGISEYDFQKESFTFEVPDRQNRIRLSDMLDNLYHDLEIADSKGNSLREIQRILVQQYNIFWIPIVLDEQEHLDLKLKNILR